jgi:Domain of unknown function (DUF362)
MKEKKRYTSKKQQPITRRKFIADTSIAAIGGTLLLNTPSELLAKPQEKKSSVVLIRDKNVLDSNRQPVQTVVQEMLDQAVIALTGKKDVVAGWKTFLKPSDIVGIKTNVWRNIPTTSEVEQALKKRVMDVGVGENNISISDRRILHDRIFKKATALINARPMRTHHWSGVGSLIKNYIMFVPEPQLYHGDSCADLAKIWYLPHVKDKTRLNVLVMFTPQFHNVGPHGFSPRHVWEYYGMLVGFDPVAIDTIGVQIIQEQRKIYFGEDRPLNPPAKHIPLADTRHKLGNADPKKINLIKIGYDKDILI